MEPTFDVYLNGELLTGFSRDTVVGEFSRLFKLELSAAEQLVNGKPRRVKSGCTKASALQYRSALTGIGLGVTVQRSELSAEIVPPGTAATPVAAPSTEKSMRARSVLDSLLPPKSSGSAKPGSPEQLAHIAAAKARDPGTHAKFEAFKPGEKPIEFEVEPRAASPATELSLAPVGAVMSEHQEERPYTLVNTPEYEVAAAGELIPSISNQAEPLNPSTDHLHLAPVDKENET